MVDQKITSMVEASSIDATTYVPIVKTVNGAVSNYKYKLTDAMGSDPLKANILNPSFDGSASFSIFESARAFVISNPNIDMMAIDGDGQQIDFAGTIVLPSTTSIGTVSSTELSRLDGVTSNIQTQLNAKSPLTYRLYSGIFNQVGTNAPTVTVLENTLNASIEWTRSSAGVYVGTCVGEFTVDKTVSVPDRVVAYHTSTQYILTLARYSDNVINLVSQTTGNVPTDDLILNKFIEIRIYN